MALPSQEWPAGQAEHSRLTDAVGVTVSCCVGRHERTTAHGLLSSALENVTPTMQGEHSLSCELEPSAVLPDPMAHVAQGEHDAVPPGANVPLAQAVQDSLASPEKVPAGHVTHAAPLLDEYVPASQEVH